MDLRKLLASRWGVVTRAQLTAAGYSRDTIRQLIAQGLLVPVGRTLVASDRARPEVVRAARLGTRVACVSAARLRKIWVVDDGRFHVSVRANHSHLASEPGVRIHWVRRPLDGADHPAVESVRNMLLHIAQCQPRDFAVAAFDSAINKRFITREEVQRLAGVRGGRFAQVAALTDGSADSGIESLPRVRLLDRGIHCRPQAVVDGRRVDLLIGSRLVIQADGFDSHSDPAQHRRDLEQDRRLRLMGYTVLRYSYSDIMFRWPAVEAEILGAIAQGLHGPPHRGRR
ncbi:MAG TPA: type IV toxin-antitoxin system AbiEi family antitoxin domain-containing protein [Gryllotalpicola sp.]